MRDLAELKEVSARIGGNPLLIQGGGGNSSLKHAKTMWVKASGCWLSDALKTPMFVPVDLKQIHQSLENDELTFDNAICKDVEGGNLRPSIETGLHALMPHRVVLHAHPVNAITVSIMDGSRARIEEQLNGLSWAMLEYVKPGGDLSLALKKLLKAQVYDVVVLRNHGVVIGADTALEAEALLVDVEQRLAFSRNPLDTFPMPVSACPEGYEWYDDPVLTGMAYQRERAQALCDGALVPDQVVYLGGEVGWVDIATEVQGLSEKWLVERGVSPGLVFVANKGALVRSDLSKGGLSIISLLRDIAHTLPSEVSISTLTRRDEEQLLNWEAEAFRLQLDKDRKSPPK